MAAITWLSNAGVVLELGGVTLMVDGLYSAGGPPFSDVPETVLAQLRADYVAVTHTHRDHLDWRKLESWLVSRPTKGLLLPPRVRGERHGVPTLVMSGVGGTVTWPELTVTWRRTPHLEHARPEHHSFLVKGEGRSILVSGDAMASPELEELLLGEYLDAALVTPLLLQSKAGQRLAHGADRVFLYHLPRPEDDRWDMLRLAQRQADRWGVTPLTRPGERVELS